MGEFATKAAQGEGSAHCAAGDAEAAAFTKFYDAHTARLFRFVLVLASGNEDLAKEVHQRAMINAARRFKNFESDAQAWGWLCKIARNTHIDLVRKEGFLSRLRALWRAEPQVPVPDESELSDCLENALTKLAADDAELVRAVYFRRQTHQQAAESQDLSAKAVERRLYRIRQELKAAILKELQQ